MHWNGSMALQLKKEEKKKSQCKLENDVDAKVDWPSPVREAGWMANAIYNLAKAVIKAKA